MAEFSEMENGDGQELEGDVEPETEVDLVELHYELEQSRVPGVNRRSRSS